MLFRSVGLVPGGRLVERSATLTLGAPAARVDDVAQDVLSVVARFDGVVDQSSVVASRGRNLARFTLRLPSGRLGDALDELSHLPDAHVVSRSDDTIDVNRQVVSLRRQLENRRAERAGLLHALANVTSETEALRLRTRLDAVERLLGRLEAQQRALHGRIAYSPVLLTVQAQRGGVGGGSSGGDLTPGRALHAAGRVLLVTAGVIVIGAAALVPLALLLALGWPLALALRRRRREQALDAA